MSVRSIEELMPAALTVVCELAKAGVQDRRGDVTLPAEDGRNSLWNEVRKIAREVEQNR